MFSKFLFVLVLAGLAYGRVFKSGCRFEKTNLSENRPEIIDEYGVLNPFFDPLSQKWFYEAAAGSQFRTKCAEPSKHIGMSELNEIDVECVVESIIKTPQGLRNLDSLTCNNERLLAEEVYRNGTCFNGFTNIEIAFTTASPPYSLITVCHNEDLDETLFVKSRIRGADLDDGESINRPDFKEGTGFYPEIDVDGCYKTASQIETVVELLGSRELVDEYIQPGANLFMSRGHLCPNGDGIEAEEKRATFYFLNCIPQWQTINGGNWNQLEIKSRAVAEERQATLTIYTGTYGVTTLDDVNGNPVELWLGKDSQGNLLRRLPVPHWTWKVIHDEQEGDAVAVIQINNPWNAIKAEDILCEDVCDQIPWVDWKVTDVRLGYTYCCTVESLAKAIPWAPQLGNLPLLV